MRRRSFWVAQLGLNVLAVALASFVPLLLDGSLDRIERGLGALAAVVAFLCSAVSILLQVRRLHDLDLRGFWLLLPVPFGAVGALLRGVMPVATLPLLATSLLALLMMLDGTAGDNRFGPDPKRRPAVLGGTSTGRPLFPSLDKSAIIAMAGIMLLLLVAPWRLGLTAALLPSTLAARIGDAAVREAVPPYWRCPAPEGERVLTRLAGRLSPDLPVRITYTTFPEINGLALPVGRIVVGEQAVRASAGAAQFAALLAHELAHVRLRHPERRTVASIGLALVPGALLRNGQIVTGQAARYSRADEAAADAEAARMLTRAGVSPRHLGDLLVRMESQRPSRSGNAATRLDRWSASHPSTPERIARLDRYPLPETEVPPLSPHDWAAVRAGCEAGR